MEFWSTHYAETIKSFNKKPKWLKWLLATAVFPFILMSLEMVVSASVITLYLYISSILGTFCIAFVLSDSIVKGLIRGPTSHGESLTDKLQQKLRGLICDFVFSNISIRKTVMASSPLGTTVNRSSPKKRQRLLQNEIEMYVRSILEFYVANWAIFVSPHQTLDKEIENDLRRIIARISEKIRNLDMIRLTQDLLKVVIQHIKNLNLAASKAESWQKLEEHFEFQHPVLSKEFGTHDTVESYLNKHTETLLRTFQVHKIISNRLSFLCVINIISFKVLVGLADHFTDPNHLKSYLSPSASEKKEENNKISEEKVDKNPSAEDDTLETQPQKTVSNDCSSVIDPSHHTLCSASNESKKSSIKLTKTIDLTGYSLNKDSKLWAGSGLNGGGKISVALGGFFSASAGPLLPDNIAFKSWNKMWRSNSNDFHWANSSFSHPSSPVQALGRKRSIGEAFFSGSRRLVRLPSFELENPSSPLPIQKRNRPHIRDIYEKKRRSFDSLELQCEGDDRPSGPNSMLVLKSSGKFRPPIVKNGTITPDYDDPEDLESTISKLRALLQERDSSETNSSNDKESFESQTTQQQSLESQCSSLDPLNLENLPANGRLFMNVCIPSIDSLVLDDSSRFDEGVVLYVIKYDGIYLEPTGAGSHCYQYITQERAVKRRFKEFLNLQLRLEDNAKLKAPIKGIKGPNKWLNLPFTKQNEQSLELRRVFLEKWLELLCQQPLIAVSQELKDFLAYGDDGSAAFDHKNAEDATKINRFSKKVSGVLHSIKDALPTFEDEATNSLQSLPAVITPNQTFSSLSLTPTSLLPNGENSIFGRKATPTSYKADFEFYPKDNKEASEVETRLELQAQHFDQSCKKSANGLANSWDETRACSFAKFHQHRLEKLESDLESDAGIARKLISLISNLLEDQILFLQRKICNDVLKSVLADDLEIVLTQIVNEHSDEDAWIGFFKKLRIFLWESSNISTIDEDSRCCWKEFWANSDTLGDSKEAFLRKVEGAIQSKDINMELALNMIDMLAWHLIETDDND